MPVRVPEEGFGDADRWGASFAATYPTHPAKPLVLSYPRSGPSVEAGAPAHASR
jgi:hypothetical protein